VRQGFFSPRVRVRGYEELNAWLVDRCIGCAKAHPHPEVRDRTIWQMFEAERPSRVPYAGHLGWIEGWANPCILQKYRDALKA
jgi:hypothetical protein